MILGPLPGIRPALAEPSHGISMYGAPQLPEGSPLPYANPDAPIGGTLVEGNVGTFDSLNPFVLKGTPPWQLRFLTHESLMYRSQDEPFALYGLLAESVETDPDRTWVEFTLRPEARFSDGSPVTVEDVIWSYETLGTEGNARYAGLWRQIASIEATGERTVRITFSAENRELPLIAALRPILKKGQYEGKDFANSSLTDFPIGSAAYVIDDFQAGRSVTLKRNPDYWGRDLPIMQGVNNIETYRIEFFGDERALFESFKAGEISFVREFNAEAWERDYAFPAVQSGEIVKTEVPSEMPSGMTGFVMNTRRAPFDDIRVRDALIHAFNFEYMNETVTGGRQPRITSYFSGSTLGMGHEAAQGRVAELLAPFSEDLPEGAVEGYALPVSDGTVRNRANLRTAARLLDEAGWTVGDDGQRRNEDGQPLRFEIIIRTSEAQYQPLADIYLDALQRLGVQAAVNTIDEAQYEARMLAFDYDMTPMRRALSLSPGTEQRLYWGTEAATQEGSRNWMGAQSPAIDAMIDAMLVAVSMEDFTAAVKALDRVLMAERYVIPFYSFDVGRIAHRADLTWEGALPIYGDSFNFMPAVWWIDED